LALLSFLLLNANRAVSNDRLQEALWAEQEPAGAPKRVPMAIGRLRKNIQPIGRAQVLLTVNGGYLLSVADGELDADTFARGAATGRALLDAGDPTGASDALSAALRLWRGPPLAEVCFEGFAMPEISRLEQLRLDMLETRIEADLALGRHGAVTGELQALSVAHPTRERICEQLMLGLYRCGRQTDALDAYRRIRAYLADELGLEPGPALQSVQAAVLAHAPWLGVDAGGVRRAGLGIADDACGIGDGRVGGQAADSRREPSGPPRAPPEPGFAMPPGLGAPARGVFVGQTAAVEQLRRSLRRVISGRRQIVVVTGEPGIGKTRLATEFAIEAQAAGAVILYGRCDEGGLLPHQPFVEALRHYAGSCPTALLAGQLHLISGELRRIVPELGERVPGLGHPLAGDPDGARHRLFEAVAALLCEASQSRPLVLVLDDLHWADEASLLLLKYVARYPRQAKLMVLGTSREVDVDRLRPVTGMLADLAREHLFERVRLGCLDQAGVSRLVECHAGGRASPELARTVFEETGGNAFFVVEILRHLAEAGWSAGADSGQEATPAGGRLSIPDGVRDVIGRRVMRLGPQTGRVLAAAAVVGRAFDLETLEAVSDLGRDELVDALDLAIEARLVEESAAAVGQYAFSHALIRDVLYGLLTNTRRGLLHHRVAVAIEQAHKAALEPHLGQLAHHFGLTGSPEGLAAAIVYGRRAGERAITLLAYEEAAAHYRRAILLVDAFRAPERRGLCCDLTIAQGDAERMAGDPTYRDTLLRAAGMAQELDDDQRLGQAALANTRGLQSSSQGVDHARVGVLETALSRLDGGDSATHASLLVQLAVELVGDGDWRRRTQLSDAALTMARRVGEPGTLARVIIQRVVAQWNPSTLTDRRGALPEALQLAEGSGHPLLAAQAAYLASRAAVEIGDLDRAERMLARLGDLVDQLRQLTIEWYAAIERAKLGVITSSPKEAERLASVAYEIGRRAGQPDATVWFLGHVFAARFVQGTLEGGDPDLTRLFEEAGSSPLVGPEFTPSRSIPLMVTAGISATLCEIGRVEDGSEHFEVLMEELTDLPNDYSTLALLAHAAVACTHLRDAPRAERLYVALEPYRAQFVSTGASWFGAVVHYLALLCATIGRPADADAQFTDAVRAYESLGAEAWLGRCRLDWAAALIDRGNAEPGQLGALLDEALATARRLGLPAIERRVGALRTKAAAQHCRPI
jgi:DNA-binding SARP family transcriptional activator